MNFKNPQVIHIISEVVVLIGLVLWVSFQNRRLSKKIENLLQRCEEQELNIQKVTELVTRLENLVGSQPRVKKQQVVPQPTVVDPRIIQEQLDRELDRELERELAELRTGTLPTIPEEEEEEDGPVIEEL